MCVCMCVLLVQIIGEGKRDRLRGTQALQDGERLDTITSTEAVIKNGTEDD